MFKEESSRVSRKDDKAHPPGSLKVSILVLTYNHERYIEQALKGALRQRTQFDFEIVIADDCSRDRTYEIVRAIAREHPERCRLLHREQNLGICKNFADAYGACRGEYVAILEGDDIWHDAHKLQRLTTILDHQTDCSFVFHNVRLLFEDGRIQESCCPPTLKPKYHLLDFIADNPVPNCSAIMFRNKLIPRFPDWFISLAYYDWPLHVLNLEHGSALYLNETLSTYRIHASSAWHGASRSHQLAGMLSIFQAIDRHFSQQYDSIIRLNTNYRKLQFEYDQLHRHVQDVTCRLQESERQRADLLNSRSYKLVRMLSRVKRLASRLPFTEKKAA